ncbi:hypothetical protein TOPH_08474 [Tolypocladium ophioglossoides CBS 100239]|uniref:Aminoglycoside phosphotransferase domain-containing protein n=1 Tax=Tolypocladium ophioglossoides (strain CBS 100239) TaxID=1163406 RepID=A0A0L0MYD0_TOLOC|nr:hypothetical protein TOPH_08474 [Tolypocladium ophioglossoides CBS 100239]
MSSQARHLFGDRILLSRRPEPTPGMSWSDGNGSFYTMSEAPTPPPPSRPLSATTHIKKVYDAGDASAVWDLGDAFCKAKNLDPETTREHTTLAYLRSKPCLSFTIPHVYYHAEYDGRYYIILSRVAGETLGKVWPSMNDDTKQHYVYRVANICRELSAWQSSKISGADGGYLSDQFLTPRSQERLDFRPESLVANCKAAGMDCTTYFFYHCDLGPGNILLDVSKRTVGIIDWETAGFVPREWIRTKFHISSGMDLDMPGDDGRIEWRVAVRRQLAKEGFPEVADEWYSWWRTEEV